MIYTLENAKLIVQAYTYLVKSYLDTGTRCTDIIIVPIDKLQNTIFFEYYKSHDAPSALQLCGYRQGPVQILLICEQTIDEASSQTPLDVHLEKHGIERIFDEAGVPFNR